MSKEQQEEKKTKRLKAITGFKEEAKKDVQLNSGCCCGALLLVVLLTLGLSVLEFATKCARHATTRALDLHVEVKCDASGIEDAAAQKKPIFFSCPLDKTSFAKWGPQNFSFTDAKSLFSVKAAWVDQKVSMLQCVETLTESTSYDIDSKTMKQTQKVVRDFSYRAEWLDEHVPSEGFSGIDGRLLSANPESKAKLQEACGAKFKGNPPFPSGMKTETKSAKSVTVAGGKIDVSSFKTSERFKMQPISLSQKKTIPAPYKISADGNALVTCSDEDLAVGCLRISYKQSNFEAVSALAMPVKKSSFYGLEPWEEQHESTSTGGGLTCEDSPFSKVRFFAPVIETANDMVAESLRSALMTIIQFRVGFAFAAMAALGIVVNFFPKAAACVWDEKDQLERWYKVYRQPFPAMHITLWAAMMVLGCASWQFKDDLTGKVGVAAAVVGCLVGLQMYLSPAGEDDDTTAPTAKKSQ